MLCLDESGNESEVEVYYKMLEIITLWQIQPDMIPADNCSRYFRNCLNDTTQHRSEGNSTKL